MHLPPSEKISQHQYSSAFYTVLMYSVNIIKPGLFRIVQNDVLK